MFQCRPAMGTGMSGEKVELVTAPVHFIGAWVLENVAVCDDLIQLFKSSPDKATGSSLDRHGKKVIDPNKESVDLSLPPDSPRPAFRSYIAELQKVVQQYIAEYPWCNEYGAWTIVQPVNIQFYPKGGGYKNFHTERTSAHPSVSSRHLVFMTYLNDVHDQGGTEFLHQKLTVSARKGLTLIWPADWTHTHRGIVSETEEKYIITGWFGFILGQLVLSR